jgi:phosphatidylglycerophosphate synthase
MMVAVVRVGPVIGLTAQLVLLVILTITANIGWFGWLAGLSYGLLGYLILQRGLRRAGLRALGPANGVTLTRAVLVGGVTALVADSFTRTAAFAQIVTISTVALVLDNVDGRVARRTRTESELGARFDMEIDAFLIVVLSVLVARDLGVWVVAIGAMRYAYVVAGWLWPWLRRPVPPRYWRKVVAATEGIVLTCAASGLFPRPLIVAAVAASLALLVESFGRDVVWQWRHRRSGA